MDPLKELLACCTYLYLGMAIYSCTTKDIYSKIFQVAPAPSQKTKTKNQLTLKQTTNPTKTTRWRPSLPLMNHSHSSILNECTHLSKQIRNNAIAIASTSQKKQTMASVPPPPAHYWINPIELCGEIEGRKIIYKRLAEIILMRTTSAGAGGILQRWFIRAAVKNR